MKTDYITSSMKQYETWTESLMKTMQKHHSPYRIKRPETRILVASAALIAVVLVVGAQLIL